MNDNWWEKAMMVAMIFVFICVGILVVRLAFVGEKSYVYGEHRIDWKESER